MKRTPRRPANSWEFSQVHGCNAIQCLECTWSRGVWIAALARSSKQSRFNTFARTLFYLLQAYPINKSFDFDQKIGQNSIEHSKLLRCPSEKQNWSAAWSFAGKSDVSSAASTLSPWFCLVWHKRATDSNKVCKGAMLSLGLPYPLN